MARQPADHKPKAVKPKRDVSLFKVVVQVYCVERNEKGEIVDEIRVDPFSVFPPQFDNFPGQMQSVLANVKKQLAAQQNGSN